MQERFEALRRRWFPAERNLVPAHVTLFHALPDAVEEAAEALAAVGRESFDIEITGVRRLGRGVALDLASAELSRRRAAIARRFAGRLGRQDSAPFRPHVTVQNKVTPAEARALHASLSAGFERERAMAGAFHLWRYQCGPWEALMTVALGTGAT